MGLFSKMFPPITAAKSFAVTVSAREAHDRVLAALTANGYTGIQDHGEDIHAEHGEMTFVYGTVSTDISLALAASPSDLYPIAVDVDFHDIEGGSQVVVNARYLKPVTFVGAPRTGPMSTKWHEACDTAVATVVAALSDVLV